MLNIFDFFNHRRLDFASWDRTARTVYLSMVSLAWPEIVSQYLLFNFEYAPSIYLFRQVNKTMKSYIDKLPYAFLLFTLGCICYSLFFRNLFIPQVFHYLDVNQVLGTNNLLKLQSDVVNRSVINLMEIRKQFQQPSSLVDSQMLTAFNEAWNAIKNNFISPFLFGVSTILIFAQFFLKLTNNLGFLTELLAGK